MPAQRTPRREALAGAGTTASLLAATIGGALVVAGLLGAGAFPGGPDDGSSDSLRIASPPARERTVSIVLPQAPRARAALTLARTAPASRHPRRAAAPAPSRPTPMHGAAPTAPAPAAKSSPRRPSAPPATAPPGTPAPGGPLAPVSNAAREATTTATGAVEPASPPLAAAVGAAGDAAANTVEDAGEIVATLTSQGR
jgi:hypothetical protein